MESAGNQAVLVPEKLGYSSRQSPVMQDDSALEQQPPTVWRMEDEEEEAKRLKGEKETEMKWEEEHRVQAGKAEVDVSEAKGQTRRRSSHFQKEQSWVRRRAALLGSLREIKGAAEELGLQEASLPALQQRYSNTTAPESSSV